MNIAQNFQAYLTPLFIVVLIAYALWCFYSITSKKHRKSWNKLHHNNVDTRRKAAKNLTFALGARLVVFVFLVFAYFFAYGPSEVGKDIKAKESGQMVILKETQFDSLTKEELKQDANERRDVTEYLNQVGDEEALKKQEEENEKLIEKTLKKYE